MPIRFRSKENLPFRYRYGNGPWTIGVPQFGASFETMRDNMPGGGPCEHVKRLRGLNYYASPWDIHVENEDVPPYIFTPPTLKELDWANLPSSTEANIITFLAEIDDTIAMLTTKFWRQLSYGAVTWGIVPLIDEIKSGLKAIDNIAQSIDGTHYEAETSDFTDIELWAPRGRPYQYYKGKRTTVFHAYGKAYYKGLEFSAFLDRLGFHPDPATLWELVPFSFVVDYIFPIGKFLEGLRRGGWVKAVYFNGTVSAKVHSDGYMYAPPWMGPIYTPKEVPYEYTSYFRYPQSSVLVAPEAELPTFELPTFEEAYNMAYLANKKLRSITPPVHWDWVFTSEGDN